jgi:hypothetical protein
MRTNQVGDESSAASAIDSEQRFEVAQKAFLRKERRYE